MGLWGLFMHQQVFAPCDSWMTMVVVHNWNAFSESRRTQSLSRRCSQILRKCWLANACFMNWPTMFDQILVRNINDALTISVAAVHHYFPANPLFSRHNFAFFLHLYNKKRFSEWNCSHHCMLESFTSWISDFHIAAKGTKALLFCLFRSSWQL